MKQQFTTKAVTKESLTPRPHRARKHNAVQHCAKIGCLLHYLRSVAAAAHCV